MVNINSLLIMNTKEFKTEVGGKTLIAQFTDLADQANGSVILRMGNTAVMATAVMSCHLKEGLNYFPLSVEFEEKFYAAGAILGSRFMRREGKPSDEAVLSGRAIDRTIRPLFEQYIRNEIQVVVSVLSIDEYDPDVLGITAASIALATSDIPWNGPVSAVRIGAQADDKELEVNPTYKYRDDSSNTFDMIACGKEGNINMIEVAGNEKNESMVSDAFKKASEEIEKIQEFQKKIIKEIGKAKQEIPKREVSKEMVTLFDENIESKMLASVFSGAGKEGIHSLKDEWFEIFNEKLEGVDKGDADDYFENKVNDILHKEAIENDKRADGRSMDEVRELYAQAGNFSPMIHGTGIFYRGGTHVFSALTLGSPEDSLLINSIENPNEKRTYIHHYNFPPFSVGETGRVGGFNRRMIGHGALAEKALIPVLPSKEEFPYTIRIVSESMASNGSTSMASACGSTLALMDAGVPIKRPVAGIASGLMMDKEGNYKLLTDIQGPEDHHGDMDFKVAGTREGVTAIQMDVKVDGIPVKILTEALDKAKNARLQILDVIEKEISTPRDNISPYAPEIISIKIDPSQIGMVIGPGGKVINKMKEDTGVQEITLEDDGCVFITGRDGSATKAKEIIEAMTHEYKAGEKFDGVVTRVTDFGAFVRIGPGTEGLVHISEVAPFRIKSVNGILKEGDSVPVIIKEVDEKKRINLSIKAVAPDFAKEKGASPEQS